MSTINTINTTCLYIHNNSYSEICGINEQCKTFIKYIVNTTYIETSKDKINAVRFYYIKYNIKYKIYIYIYIYIYLCMGPTLWVCVRNNQ